MRNLVTNLLKWFRTTRQQPAVTEDMVFSVIPTTWMRQSKIRERLLQTYDKLIDEVLSDAAIYTHLRELEAQGHVECSTRKFPKVQHEVGICRKIGPGGSPFAPAILPLPTAFVAIASSLIGFGLE